MMDAVKHVWCIILLASALLVLSGCADSQPSEKRFEFREDKAGHLMRLNTITGEARIADDGGSRELFPPEDTNSLGILNADQIVKVTGNGLCNQDQQSFQGRIYNGSNLVIRSVGIVITHKKFLSDEVAWKREFIARGLYIRPQEVQTLSISLTGVEGPHCDWSITHAYGSPWPPLQGWDRFFK